MRIDQFKPKYLTDEDSKDIATRQILSFLSVNDEERKKRAKSKALFSLSKIPPDAFMNERPFLRWQSREIRDVDGALLFWDQSIKLDETNTLTVRTAGSNLLRTPVWSVRAGPTRGLDTLIAKTVSVINDSPGLKPIPVDHAPQLICYAYPKLGILAASSTQPNTRFVLDLWERKPIPVEENSHDGETDANDSAYSIWSPYDLVTRATVARFRARWDESFSTLNAMPSTPERLFPDAALARAKVEELTTKPELNPVIFQESPTFCVPATVAMILRYHNINKTQFDIATELGTDPSWGTPLANQADRIDDLTDDAFKGELDLSASFVEAQEEIIAGRPFKTGGEGHARACCGYMIEDNVAKRKWLYIYDPMPVDSGDVYFESWEALYHGDYIYVRPTPSR